MEKSNPKKSGRDDNDSLRASLEGLRGRIDSVDREILAQLNARAELVQEVGALKKDRNAPVYVASRERDLVQRLVSENMGPFPAAGIPHVFREIVSATRSLEETVRVAFLGPAGTFSHEAAVKQFGALVDTVPAASMREVFELAERGEAHYGVVPVENTIEGVVTTSLDALVESELNICAEILLEVSQNLLSQSGQLEDIVTVASHPQPLGQCGRWLESRLPGVSRRETASTAAAALLAGSDPGIAAIASEVAADAYGLRVVERGIEDSQRNSTRFIVVGREVPAASGNDLTAAVFTVRRDLSGALYRLLEPFARNGVNLSSIQSRPMKGKAWEYLFFVDVEGHTSEESVARALNEAGEVAQSSKILGSFPRAEKTQRRVPGAAS